MLDRSGQHFDNYRLIRLLGRGTFGEVYLAEHLDRKVLYAIKVLRARLSLAEFLNEARSYILLEHPNILRIRDMGVIEQDTPFLVTEYMPKGTLRKRYPPGTRLPLATIISYVKQIAEALYIVHEYGIVHRDMKPENLLVGPQDEILLSDFGIATFSFTKDLKRLQDVSGTVSYMAPEQILGQAVCASDQYALAIIVYEWFTGIKPFTGKVQDIINKQLYTSPISPRQKIPTISTKVEEVIMKALEKKVDRRFSSIRDFANALEQAIHTSSQVAPLEFHFYGHTSGVRSVAWSPTSRFLASGGSDALIRVWEATTGSSLITYHGHEGELLSVAWSPDNTSIASAGNDRTIQVWQAMTGLPIQKYLYHKGSVNSLAWSPDSSLLASASEDGSVHLWEVNTGHTIKVYPLSRDGVAVVAWSPDSNGIACGCDDTSVLILDKFVSGYRFKYNQHLKKVTGIAWSPNSRMIASASDDRTVHVWDSNEGESIYIYKGHKDAVVSVSWSPNGRYIASGSWDQTIHIWDAFTGKCLSIYSHHTNWVNSVAWSPDGKYIASGSWDRTVHVFSPDLPLDIVNP